LDSSLSYFSQVPVKISDFGPMDAAGLNNAQKESILRFLEEALCNVEQHAQHVTRLSVVCKSEEGQNIIRVVDNGRTEAPPHGESVGPGQAQQDNRRQRGGNGSRQAKLLARRLGGTFDRRGQSPRGTVCELVWPVQWRSPSRGRSRMGRSQSLSFMQRFQK
ncbi:MAG: ATP-binding protein, partial [Cyanobacteria bacterium J06649_4]